METSLPSRSERAAVPKAYVTFPALPDIRGRKVVIATAIGLCMAGFAIAVATNTPEVFSRAGNLIALAAAAFAYYGPCDPQSIERWARDSMDCVDLDAQIIWDRYNEDSGVEAAKKASPIPSSLFHYLAAISEIDWPAQANKPTQLDYWNVLQGLTQSSSGREKLTNDLNQSLYSIEFRVATFGVILSTVGDWILKPLIVPILSFVH